jgi:DNA-binding winged helix-turn-helix (wHTH) protein
MTATRFQFDDFTLDAGDRRLLQAGEPVELGSRYFDALLLLLREHGKLVSKDRLLDDAWHGVPVTDEALTQCVRTLRRQLGDDAARPRFIETVPKHGYRFIGAVHILEAEDAPALAAPAVDGRWSRFFLLGGAGMAGGGVAGIAGGLLYGFGLNAGPTQAGIGATSALFVLLALNMLVGLVGGAGVAFGIATAEFARIAHWQWSVVGGGVGGFLIGALTKLIGLDAFRLFLGRPLADMTGALEGALLGAAVGLAASLIRRSSMTFGRSILLGGLAAGVAGLFIPLLGGRLLGGSLDLLLRQFPNAGFQLKPIGAIFGETGFGPISRTVSSGIESALFGACLLGAFFLVRQASEAERR